MSENNPWKTLTSRIVYQNPWITVREDGVIRPDGDEGIYSVVGARVATGVVTLTAENEIYLVGQFRYATNVYTWEIIEGGADAEELPLDAAKRELQEEAGLIAKEWITLGGKVQLTNCHSSEIGYLYLARELSETNRSPDGTEILQLKKMPFREVLQLAEDGKIEDALSIIGILRTARLLRM